LNKVYNLRNTRDESIDDPYTYALTKKASRLAQTRLAGYCLEKLGIKYKIINDRNYYPYLQIVENGTKYYGCPNMYSTVKDEIVSYNLYNDYPIYDFFDLEAELTNY